MGNQKSKTQETVTINNNNNQEMDFGATLKLDAFCIFCILLIVFLVFKLNKYFKNYVQKKAVVQV